MRCRLFLATLLVAAAAHANSISDQVSVYRPQSTNTSPRVGSVTDSFDANFDLSDQWSLSAGAMVTLQGKSPASERGQFGSSGNLISLFSLGLDFEANEHWTFAANVDLSPRSTQYAGTEVLLTQYVPKSNPLVACVMPNPAPGCEVDPVLVRSQTSQLSPGLSVGYETAGETDLEWSFNAAASYSHLETLQKITLVRTPTGTASAQQVKDFCAASPTTCPNALLRLLVEQQSPLDWERLSLSATAIISKDTDLTLSGDYYIYQQDPAQVAYFTFVVAGRSPSQAGGNGVSIAPLHYQIRPEILQRFGDFSAKLWVQAGKYEPGTGQSTAGAGIKLQYKFSKAFKMWVTGGGQRDVDESSNATNSGSFGLGASYRF
jgi:hypothetical protein